MLGSLAGSPTEEMMRRTIFDAFEGRVKDREFMTDWFNRRNQAVIDALPAARLLVYSPKEGWGLPSSFLGIAVPYGPFPRINSRDEIGPGIEGARRTAFGPGNRGDASLEIYIEQLKAKAFGELTRLCPL